MISKTLATKAQRDALYSLWDRNGWIRDEKGNKLSYSAFRRQYVYRACPYSAPDTLMVNLPTGFGPMDVGVEPDGYVHS